MWKSTSVSSRRRGDGVEDERAVNLIPTQSSNAYEAMTSRIGVPRLTRMTVISPVFLLCARTVIMPSSPDDGAAADGRLLVDVTEFVLLVTEFLLSFVGTLAGLKLSSDIAACIQRAQRFQSFLGYGVTRGIDRRGRRRSGVVAARTSLAMQQCSKSYGAAHTEAANQLDVGNETRPVHIDRAVRRLVFVS